MTKPVIYSFIDFKPEQQAQLRKIAPDYELVLASEQPEIPSQELAIVIGWRKDRAAEILAAPNLAWVQSISAGVDYLPLAEFAQRHILVSNGSGIHVNVISEHVLGVMLGRSRGLFAYQKDQAQQQWLPGSVPLTDLNDEKLLIFGAGHIGQMLAKRASALGITVYGVNTAGESRPGFQKMYTQETVGPAIKAATTIVNIMPLTPTTKYYFNRDFFAKMNPQASFINVGRGASVKTTDLVAALQAKQLAFAALDVFESEPLANTSPLWQMANVLITPHIAGQVPHFRQKLLQIVAPNLTSFVQEQQLTVNEIKPGHFY